MGIVTGDAVARFVSEQIGCAFVPPYTTMGIERGGKIIGGVIFNVFEGCDVHVSAAGKGWTRGFLADVGQYVFGHLGLLRMTVITEQENVIDIAKRLGAQVEGRLRDHFGPSRDAIVLGILKNDYIF